MGFWSMLNPLNWFRKIFSRTPSSTKVVGRKEESTRKEIRAVTTELKAADAGGISGAQDEQTEALVREDLEMTKESAEVIQNSHVLIKLFIAEVAEIEQIKKSEVPSYQKLETIKLNQEECIGIIAQELGELFNTLSGEVKLTKKFKALEENVKAKIKEEEAAIEEDVKEAEKAEDKDREKKEEKELSYWKKAEKDVSNLNKELIKLNKKLVSASRKVKKLHSDLGQLNAQVKVKNSINITTPDGLVDYAQAIQGCITIFKQYFNDYDVFLKEKENVSKEEVKFCSGVEKLEEDLKRAEKSSSDASVKADVEELSRDKAKTEQKKKLAKALVQEAKKQKTKVKEESKELDDLKKVVEGVKKKEEPKKEKIEEQEKQKAQEEEKKMSRVFFIIQHDLVEMQRQLKEANTEDKIKNLEKIFSTLSDDAIKRMNNFGAEEQEQINDLLKNINAEFQKKRKLTETLAVKEEKEEKPGIKKEEKQEEAEQGQVIDIKDVDREDITQIEFGVGWHRHEAKWGGNGMVYAIIKPGEENLKDRIENAIGKKLMANGFAVKELYHSPDVNKNISKLNDRLDIEEKGNVLEGWIKKWSRTEPALKRVISIEFHNWTEPEE
jgi:hypothetical protein